MGRVGGLIRLMGMLLSLLRNVGGPRGNGIDSKDRRVSELLKLTVK